MVSNTSNFHPYLGQWSNLTDMFQMGWNHQLLISWWFLYFCLPQVVIFSVFHEDIHPGVEYFSSEAKGQCLVKAGGELAPKIRQTTWVHGDVLLDSGCFFFCFRRWINGLLCGSWKGAMCFHSREWFGGISRIYVDNRTFDCSSMPAIN